jgi:hypothetical protein
MGWKANTTRLGYEIEAQFPDIKFINISGNRGYSIFFDNDIGKAVLKMTDTASEVRTLYKGAKITEEWNGNLLIKILKAWNPPHLKKIWYLHC